MSSWDEFLEREKKRIEAEAPIEAEHKRFQTYLMGRIQNSESSNARDCERDGTGFYKQLGVQGEWLAWYASSLVKR